MFRSCLTVACLAAVGPALAAPPTAYEYKAGEKATYQVDVEIDDGEIVQTLSGSPTFAVESVKDGQATVKFSGGLTERAKAKNPNAIVMPSPPRGAFSGFGGLAGGFGRGVTLVLNRRGEIVKADGDSQLPFLLGNLHELLLVPLPDSPQNRWEHKTDTQITVVTSLFPRPRLPRGFPRPSLGPTNEETLNATEATTYATGGATLKRTYRLATKEEVNGKPRIDFATTGTVTPQAAGFLPESIEWSGTLAMRKDGDESVRPIKFTARRLSDAELAERAQQAEEAKTAAKTKLAGDLPDLVSDLHSADSAKSRPAALRLLNSDVGDGNAEVADALLAGMGNADASSRGFFAWAAAKWAQPDQTDLLLSLLDTDSVPARHAAIEKLGASKAEKAAEPLAARLEVSIDRLKASPALKAFGSGAESAVAERLTSKEFIVRLEAVAVLKEIGTAKSIPMLKAATKDENILVRQRAEDAIKSIEARGKSVRS